MKFQKQQLHRKKDIIWSKKEMQKIEEYKEKGVKRKINKKK